jgi:hypothetical protein
VKAVLRGAIRDEPLLAPGREPEVLIAEFASSAITYRIRVWTPDFAADEHLRDHIRSRVYYALRRANFEIPYPMQVEVRRDALRGARTDPGLFEVVLARVEILAPLTEDQRRELAHGAHPYEFADGEAIVRQGDEGSSLFVVCLGEAVVMLEEPKREVARLRPGQFFGEMSLLTGEPRTATVSAATDCTVLEITVEEFRRLVLADPAVVERVANAVATRRADLERHRVEGAASPSSAWSWAATTTRSTTSA